MTGERPCGTPPACCRSARRATPTAQRRRPTCARCPSIEGDLPVLHRRADRAAGRRAQHHDRQARRARQQAGPAAELALDQARAAQRVAARGPRSSDRRQEVLVVKGALGAMGAGNTSVLMQLLVGMLDAALARQQDLVAAEERIGRRAEGRRGSAGAQPRLRRDDRAEALRRPGDGGLLADRRAVDRPRGARPARRAVRPSRVLRHRLGRDAREAALADDGRVLRHRAPRCTGLTALGRPDARLHLPQSPCDRLVAGRGGPPAPLRRETIPLRIDPERLALHAARQAARGGRYLEDLAQPHWERRERAGAGEGREPHGSSRGSEPEREAKGEGEIVRAGERGVGAGERGASVPHDDSGSEVGGTQPTLPVKPTNRARIPPPASAPPAKRGHRSLRPPPRATRSWSPSTRPTPSGGRGCLPCPPRSTPTRSTSRCSRRSQPCATCSPPRSTVASTPSGR